MLFITFKKLPSAEKFEVKCLNRVRICNPEDAEVSEGKHILFKNRILLDHNHQI